MYSLNFSQIIGHRRFPLVFFSGLLFLFLIHNSHISLWEQDEGAYAGFARRMLQTGDWLIPDYFWSFIHRKTPLHFWNIAISYSVFGENNFALRLSSALSVWLVYLSIYRFGSFLAGEIEIRISLLVLASSYLINFLAKMAVTDGTLLFFNTMAALALARHVNGRGSIKNTVFLWTSIALALLVKGPPVLIFIGFFAFLLLVFHPGRKLLFLLHPWVFLPLALLPLYFWGKAAWDRDGGIFIGWLLDWYVLKRFSQGFFGQTAPPGAYFLLISIAFLPFLYLQPRMWKFAWRESLRKDSATLTLLLWFVAAWFPFEWSPSKLPAYTAAAHVPFALLLGKFLSRDLLTNEASTALYRVQLIFQALIIAAIPVAGIILHLSPVFRFSSVFCATGLLLLIVKQLRDNQIQLRRLFALNAGFSVFIWLVVYGQIDPVKNIPEQIGEFLKGKYINAVIGNNHGHPPGLFVYTERNAGKAELMTNTDTLRILATEYENTAFILSAEQWSGIRSVPGMHLDTVICGQLTDRKEKACYFIASRRNKTP